jgi:hypothetical protein
MRAATAKRPPPAPCHPHCALYLRLATSTAPSTCALPPAPRPPPAPCRSPRAFNLRLAGRHAPSTCSLPVAALPPPAPCASTPATHTPMCALTPAAAPLLRHLKSTQRARLRYIGREKSLYHAFRRISCQQRPGTRPCWLGEIHAVAGSCIWNPNKWYIPGLRIYYHIHTNHTSMYAAAAT